MLKQYDLVNDCLAELQHSNLPERYRWQLEVQLYQLKRLLLLDHVAEMVRDAPDSERDFLDLYHEVRHACDPARPLPCLDALVAVQLELKKTLYSYCRREETSESYRDDDGGSTSPSSSSLDVGGQGHQRTA